MTKRKDTLLTHRQEEILGLVRDEGLTGREVALRLGISYQTVKNHFQAIYQALGLVSGDKRTKAVISVTSDEPRIKTEETPIYKRGIDNGSSSGSPLR